MSDAPMGDAARRASPFLSIWLRPRQAIDDVLASEAGRLVLPISALGGAGTGLSWLLSVGLDRALMDWRVLLACFVGGGALSILNVYVMAFVAAWLARRMGGTAPTASLRAVIAWGMLPTIVAVGLALAVIAGSRMAGTTAASLGNWLQIAVGVGSLWSLAITMLTLAHVERFGFWRTVVAYGISALFLPAVVALTIRTFLFQPFSIPSGSNSPTLLRGDYVFATKFAYGYSRYALPFAQPSFSGRLFAAEPARGDMAVFRLPKGDAVDYVKRVVGLPGDRIQMKNGELLINDVPVKREPLADYVGNDLCGSGAASVKRWRETLPNGASYETLDCVDNGFYDNTNVFTVPSGHLFVLGDNRDNSSDSRVLSVIGYVPMDNLIGRVDMIFFSRAGGEGGEPSSIRYERIGKMVR